LFKFFDDIQVIFLVAGEFSQRFQLIDGNNGRMGLNGGIFLFEEKHGQFIGDSELPCGFMQFNSLH